MTKTITRQIRAIVTCADRKRAEPVPSLLLRSHHGTVGERSVAWIERLNNPSTDRFEARELYQGEHWSEVRKLEQSSDAGKPNVEVWISSAGCGLVHLDEPLEAYSATFSKGHADSVQQQSNPLESVQWWEALSQRPAFRALPRSICDLVRRDPEVPVVIAISPPYLLAVGDDLLCARESLADPDLLTVITTSSNSNFPSDCLVCIDHRLQRIVGGSLNSLYSRALNLLVTEKPSVLGSSKATGEFLKGVLESVVAPEKPVRTSMTDAEVIGYLNSTFAVDAVIPARTTSLANLRKSGFACEQERFAKLYELARNQHKS